MGKSPGGAPGLLWGLLVAVGDQCGVEVVTRVVATGGNQPRAGVNVAQRTRLALLLAGDLEVRGAGTDRQLDVLPIAGANRDHVAVDALDFPGDVRATDMYPLGVQLAAQIREANYDVAIDFDLRPACNPAIDGHHRLIRQIGRA